jgi:hypothetical protein
MFGKFTYTERGVDQYKTVFLSLQYLSIYYFTSHKKLMTNLYTNIQSIVHKYLTWKTKSEKTTKHISTPPVDTNGKRLNDSNYKAYSAIMHGLADLVFDKVMLCHSTKEMWDKL